MSLGIIKSVKRAAVLLAVLLFLTSLPFGLTARAAGENLTVTGVSGPAAADSNGNYTINQNGTYIITGNGSAEASTITVKGCTADITLSNVNIDVSGVNNACAFAIEPGAAVNLTLEGTNVLKSGNACAGLRVAKAGTSYALLTITEASTGCLEVDGQGGGAGIGSDSNGNGVGKITVNGGTITAAGDGGAGIGGGAHCAGGLVDINGGSVTANGGHGGAGIGGGNNGGGGAVTITGAGTAVSAKGQGGGKDIGSGGSASSGGSLTVGTDSGKTVPSPSVELASAGTDALPTFKNCVISGNGAKAGGSAGVYNAGSVKTAPLDVSKGSISITADSTYVIEGSTTLYTVTVKDCRADITLDNVGIASGTGCAFALEGSAVVNLTVVGSSTLTSGGDYAGLQVPGRATLTMTSGSTGTLRASSASIGLNADNTTIKGGAGIGGKGGGASGTITVAGGTVIASTGTVDVRGSGGDIFIGAGIGGGGNGASGPVSVSGGTVTASIGAVSGTGSSDSISAGAAIGGGGGSASGPITISGGTVNASADAITVDDSNTIMYGAGIGGGSRNGAIAVTGGTVTATGGPGGAGIGAGYISGELSSSLISGTVTISGGTVTSAGGNSGAGIGGGSGISGVVSISGGTVTATGGAYGAGVGGGIGGSGTVTINGGTVNAAGGASAAGIGGGDDGSGTIAITGGVVTANGGFFGAGIGSGMAGNGNAVVISGGTVKAAGGTGKAAGDVGGAGIGGAGYYGGLSSLKSTLTNTVIITGANTSVTAEGKDKGFDIGTNTGLCRRFGTSLTVGAADMTAVPLPTVTLVSAGTNAETTFNNCVINGSGAGKYAGTYCTVAFDSNGGDTASSPAEVTILLGHTVPLPAVNPTRPGYTLAGWNTSADGSGVAFTASTTVTSGLTLYAQWTADSTGGGSTVAPGAAAASQNVTINSGMGSAGSNPQSPLRATAPFERSLLPPTKTDVSR